MRRPDHRLWALWLFGLLLVPAAVMISGWRPNDVPELTVPPEPGWAPDRFLDDAYYDEVDEWLAERNGTEGLGTYARWLVDYRVFGDSTNPEIAIGDDGMLFARRYIDNSCEVLRAAAGPAVPAAVSDLVHYTITLGKEYWFTDALAPHDRPDECAQQARAAIVERESSDPAALPVNQAIAADPERFFLPEDSHWSPEGRLRVAEVIIEELAPGLWEPEAVRAATVPRLHVYTNFLGVRGDETMAGHEIDRGLDHETVQELEALGLLIYQQSRTSGGQVIPGVTYLFGDSQLAYVVPYFDQYFEELVYVGRLRRELGPVNLDPLPPPDRIVVQSVELWVDAEIRDNPALLAAIDRLADH